LLLKWQVKEKVDDHVEEVHDGGRLIDDEVPL
jgi:hypothetical protein